MMGRVTSATAAETPTDRERISARLATPTRPAWRRRPAPRFCEIRMLAPKETIM
jgi:hypothetical protein